MNKNIYSLFLLLLVVFSSCSDQLHNPVVFGFTATSDSSSVSGDTLIVKKSIPVNFTFSGNAGIITFYSGEAGHEYFKRYLTQTPVTDIDSCYLSFTNQPQFGNIPGTLKVYLSTTFPGLNLKTKSTDSTAVMSENWINLSDSCNLSTTNNIQNKSKILLRSYVNSKITFAFHYKTADNTAIQPTWQIGNLKVIVRDKEGRVTYLSANDLGFCALNLFSTTNPYSVAGGAGVWDLTNVASASSVMKIVFSSAGAPLNDDWLISTPMIVTKRTPDTGFFVRSVATSVSSYQYSFKTPGVYTIGFQAINRNFEFTSEAGQTKIIKVQ